MTLIHREMLDLVVNMTCNESSGPGCSFVSVVHAALTVDTHLQHQSCVFPGLPPVNEALHISVEPVHQIRT